MDNTEIHYLTYDPEEIFRQMQLAHMEAGGDVLYPGDEKEMLLRSVQAVMVQAFAGVDHALRMATLRYAVGDYLDLYGENRGCYRNEAKRAAAEVQITFRATGKTGVIQAGTAVTADGARLYLLEQEVVDTGYQQTVIASVVAEETGSGGNGLLEGTQMQFLSPQNSVTAVICTKDASGGQEREDDESYRERIRTYGLANTTTGPKTQYEAAAKNVTSEILDARAYTDGAGKVNVALLLESNTGAAAIIQNVLAALNDKSVRPMTDQVTVTLAEEIPYTIHLQYKGDTGSDLAGKVAEVVADYQKWQDGSIGRAFNPDRLMASVYQAGASRVLFGDGSSFNGGTVEYTEIDENAHCKGSITIGVIA